jgi:uncharacterized surface protein with fasciclin (FAS1) repeats
MMTRFPIKAALAAFVATAAVAAPAYADHHGGKAKPAMAAKANIVEKAASLPNFSTLVTAVKAAGLVDTLAGPGPFTVFAPDNAAFGKLPAGTVETLVQPANKATLTRILTYHVVPGRIMASDVVNAVKAGGGRAVLTTVAGVKLTAMYDSHGALVLVDAKGGKSKIVATDINQSNGVIHAIDTVVMPG